ncbi:flavin reductase family protein [Streptomyces sp. NPDC035033]|uniref:flavin reductase family protein n=1 Tax=Streptomyces sp. NPDC035033 TaxID=3155368 RepID=UPI0033C9B048
MTRHPTGLTDRPPTAPAGPADPAPDRAADFTHPDQARQALRRLTSGITVLTVNRDGVRHGTTASAVVALSRDPLILGVGLRPTSTFVTMARWSGRFAVNVLSAAQHDTAHSFADPRRPLGDAQFAGHGWTTDPLSGAPLLDGCLSHMSCRILGRHRVGDHDLLLAEVVGGAHHPHAPLLSFAGTTHTPTLTPAPPAPASAPSHSEVS